MSVTFPGSLVAGVLDAEAGGAKMFERAERDMARDLRERAEKADREAPGTCSTRGFELRVEAEKAEKRAEQEKAARERREKITEVVGEVLASRGREMVMTSGRRTDSPAHRDGAVDVRSKDLSQDERLEEAREISKKLGEKGLNATVVVERLHLPEKGALGPSAQTNTAFKNGVEGNTRVLKDKINATHTHIQPDDGPAVTAERAARERDKRAVRDKEKARDKERAQDNSRADRKW